MFTATDSSLVFEANLLLGLNFFVKKDYVNAEKHFKRLNRISRYNLFFDEFIGNILIAWSKAAQSNKEERFIFLNTVPPPYRHLTQIQKIIL